MSNTSLVRAPVTTVTNTARSLTTQQSSGASYSSSSSNSNAGNTSSYLATATSVLPSLNLLTPQKSSTSTTSTSQQQQPPIVATPAGTPGKWEHPRMDEVIRRQNANNFDASNVRVILLNVGLAITTFIAPYLLETYLLPRSWLITTQPYLTYTLYALRAIFTLNTLLALTPLFRPADPCEDIPLTPAQRNLLGLPPMSRPATPQETAQYVTPPRYSRTPTQSPASSLRANAGESPLSGRGTPLDASLRRSTSGSPSLFVSQARNERRRLSYGSAGRSSPLGLSEFDAVGGIGVGGAGLATPTKSGKASVALNSKWLYEKGRGSPRASPRASGGGCVFS